MAYNRNQILQRSDLYDGYAGRWEYYIRSFLGGEEYKGGRYLQEYNLELENEFEKRLQFTPLDNHCRNIVCNWLGGYRSNHSGHDFILAKKALCSSR